MFIYIYIDRYRYIYIDVYIYIYYIYMYTNLFILNFVNTKISDFFNIGKKMYLKLRI